MWHAQPRRVRHCYRCGTRAEPCSDLSALLAPDGDRHLATLTGQPSNFVSLQPRIDTNRNRSQRAHAGRGESSGAAVVKGQATKGLKKAANTGIDGKLCYSVPDNALRINETDVYVAFMDRFYTVAATAIMALAVCRSGASPFRILGFVNGVILELNSGPAIMMAQLLTFAQQQVRHAICPSS